jgi:1,4-alpha-glucan branching enzyme
MSFGSFVLVLHSHLPFYRKAGMWPFGEENLYECMAETYMPLLKALTEVVEEGILPKVTIGITPILAEQLADPYLQQGFLDYLDTRLTAIQKDVDAYPDETTPHSQHLAFLADYYKRWFTELKHDFEALYHRNLLAGFKSLQDIGAIEIITSAATHGFSPLLGTDESLDAQYRTGVETYQKHFGRKPAGVWLPECAYRPAKQSVDPITGEKTLRPPIDAFLFRNGLDYFFTEFHAIQGGVSTGARRVVGMYGNIQYLPMPARPETGLTTDEAFWLKDYPVAVMGRNDRASFQVWSAAHGYPGDGLYREFHKKDARSGMNYWRLTSKECELGDKMLYDPILAHEKTAENADHFVSLVYHMLKDRADTIKANPSASKDDPHGLVMVSFDTELFGHWWFEGVTWLKHIFTRFAKSNGVQLQTASEYLAQHPPKTALALPESTWGQGGHYWVWQNHNTEWMWPIIHAAEYRMRDLVKDFKLEQDPLVVRTLNQALRELLLLESSDWPFLVTTMQAKDYAVERFNDHHHRFWALSKMLDHGPGASTIDVTLLETYEDLDNPFADIDFRWFSSQKQTTPDEAVLQLH